MVETFALPRGPALAPATVGVAPKCVCASRDAS